MKKKILVIEEDEDLSDNIETILTESGYKAFSSSNSNNCIEKINSILPDLIICDTLMLEKEGFAFLEKFHKEIAANNIPLLYLTSRTDDIYIEKLSAMGVKNYLSKPFKIDVIVRTIKKLLKEN